jgi:hypothetical protein
MDFSASSMEKRIALSIVRVFPRPIASAMTPPSACADWLSGESVNSMWALVV